MEKILAENEVCFFKETDMTINATQYVHKMDKSYRVILAEQKSNNEKDYLLLKDNTLIHETKNIENMLCRIDAIALALHGFTPNKLD